MSHAHVLPNFEKKFHESGSYGTFKWALRHNGVTYVIYVNGFGIYGLWPFHRHMTWSSSQDFQTFFKIPFFYFFFILFL